jgi:hypothetical protein
LSSTGGPAPYRRAIELLGLVGIAEPARRFKQKSYSVAVAMDWVTQ